MTLAFDGKAVRTAARAGALAALCLLAACKPAPATDSGAPAAPGPALTAPVTISALIWAPDWADEMRRIAAEFHRLNPDVNVALEFMSGNSVEANLKPKVAAHQLPDLMSVNPNAYAAELADRGMLADVGASQAWQRLRPGLKADWLSPNGKRFGIAGGVAATVIYYNKSMFKQAGIERLPTNFSEFLGVCERLKQAGYTPLYLSGGFPNLIANGAFSFGFANNIVPTTPDWRARIADGTLELDNSAGADMFGKIRTLVQRGYAQPRLMQSGYAGSISSFVEGRTAMAFDGTWAAGGLLHPQGFEVGLLAPPWNDHGNTSVPVIGSETGFAVAETANKAQALRFLEYLSDAGFTIEQTKRQNISPFISERAAPEGDPQIVAYLAQVERAPVTGSPYYSMLPATTIDVLHQLIADVLSNKLTARQAARRLQTSIRDESRHNDK